MYHSITLHGPLLVIFAFRIVAFRQNTNFSEFSLPGKIQNLTNLTKTQRESVTPTTDFSNNY